MTLRFCLAGQFAVEVDGAPVGTAGVGPLGRVALAYLVTERHRPVSRDELAEVLWGDELPRSWETSVRVLVSKLRALIARAGIVPTEALSTRAGCYQVHLPDAAVVDVEEAAAAVTAAERALDEAGAAAAQEAAARAVAIAARRFLPGERGPWVEEQQAELRSVHLRGLEALAAAAAAGGDWAASVEAAEDAIALEPFREQLWVRLMTSHATAGNRGEALRCYERCRRLLHEELGVSPAPATEAAYLELLVEDGPPQRAAPAPAVAVAVAVTEPMAAAGSALPPPLTSFVGREDDLAEVASLLSSTRLLTLTGTGGVGKTRLAIQAARLLEPGYGDGAVFVELASLTDAGLVAAQALAALGLAQEPGRTPTATLAASLQDRYLLLVLDNCEHLLAPCAVLTEALLSRSPGLRILATSREALRIPGERTLRVRSLSAPPPFRPGLRDAGGRPELPVDQLLAFEAVRLFAERAAAASGLQLTPANVEAAARICSELDGIPLALELAAARTGSLSLEDIAKRLDDRFPLLASGSRTAPSRQRTLQGAVDWTYEHLSAEQRTAFQRLSVFAGDFTLQAAEHLWPEGGRDGVLDLVASLVDCSVLVAETSGGAARYRLPETMRQYAAAKLGADEAESVRHRHLRWATALAERAEEGLLAGDRQADWLNAVDAELDNLRAALGWATSPAGPAGAALPLAAALGRFWEVRGHLSEGRRWIEAALAGDDDGSRSPIRARALNWAGVLAQRQGDAAAARTALQESLVIRRDLGDQGGVAAALHGLGNLAALHGDAATASRFFEECLAIGRQLGDEEVMAASLANLGWVASNQGDLATARAFDEESLALRRKHGDRHGTAMLLGNLGFLAYQEGDFAAARAFDEESLALRQELGDRHGIAMLLGNLGHLALHEGDDGAARALYEESLALRQELGDRHGEAGSLANLAELARLDGDVGLAERLVRQALRLAEELGDRYRTATLLVALGRLATVRDDLDEAAAAFRRALPAGGEPLPRATVAEWLEGLAAAAAAAARAGDGLGRKGAAERAALLLGAAAALRRTIGAPVLPRSAPALEQVRAGAVGALGEAPFEVTWTQGGGLSLEEAVALGQEVAADPG